MIFIFTTIVIIIVILILFSFPQFSPIPYFPSNKKDMDLILKALDLKNNRIIYDLGAGDGLVIFEAAKNTKHLTLNTRFVAVEINPVLILILHLRRLFHPNRKNITILWADLFKNDFKRPTLNVKQKHMTFYLYVSPWFLEKIYQILKKQFSHFRIVSYMYSIKNLTPSKTYQGKNSIFIYEC